ncbi:sel1 repeat family protein [bacterium AH-315-O15]|nr:sel1 repeat family protein [bacterium AH-315-O15]
MAKTGSAEKVVQDFVEMVRWTRLAADQGHAIAQSSLGVMYANGEGVPQDYTEAHKWINLAASRATGDDQQRDAERRDTLAKEMTRAQVDEAQRLATEWQEAFDAGIVYPYIARQE